MFKATVRDDTDFGNAVNSAANFASALTIAKGAILQKKLFFDSLTTFIRKTRIVRAELILSSLKPSSKLMTSLSTLSTG